MFSIQRTDKIRIFLATNVGTWREGGEGGATLTKNTRHETQWRFPRSKNVPPHKITPRSLSPLPSPPTLVQSNANKCQVKRDLVLQNKK